MQAQLFIPKTLKVGFQNRSDTFTGKLAYVIYYDEKGKLRKESSWEGWRDKKIEPIVIENKPMAGFVLNKGMQRNGYWGSGRSVLRVHDPREFEFEISVDNLIGILMHSDVSKRDIQEQCVFAWAGTELVLLPVNSEAYQSSVAFTQKQDQKVSAKSLVKGRRYQQKKHDGLLTYLGYFEWYDFESETERIPSPGSYWHNTRYRYTKRQVLKGKRHVFHDGAKFVTPAVSTLSGEVSEDIAENYAALVDTFFKTTFSQPIVGVRCEPVAAEACVERATSRVTLSRLTSPGGIDSISIPSFYYDNPFGRNRGTPVTAIQCTRQSLSYRTDPDFSSSRISAEEPYLIPFDESSTHAEALWPEDFASLDASSSGYAAQVRLSAKFMGHLRAQGFGHLYYVLANGNTCRGDS